MDKFYSLIVDKFFGAVTDYMSALDWGYMITLMVAMMVLGSLIPHPIVLRTKTISMAPRYRTVLVAFILALVFYGLGDEHGRGPIKKYFESMFAAMVLYMLTFDKIGKFLSERVPAFAEFKDKISITKTVDKK